MGGFCQIRDACARYHDRTEQSPAERLCGTANQAFLPISFVHASPGLEVTEIEPELIVVEAA